jgi:hypothetical protein
MKPITLYQIIPFALSFATGSAAHEIVRDLFDGSCGSNWENAAASMDSVALARNIAALR